MPYRIAEQLRQLALRCSHLANNCSDKATANELEGVSAELAEQAQKLDGLFDLIEKAS
jgi:hypothetical protein